MSRPLVSVVIPAFNAEATLRATVASVLAQSVPELEVIVVDDGSSDGTATVAASIPDQRVRVVSQPNRGPAASRNRGWSEASGEFISFIDADDLWTPEKIASQLEALRNNPSVGVAYSWTDYIDHEGARLFAGGRPEAEGDVYKTLLLGYILESGSNALVTRKVAEELKGFSETVPWGTEDWEYFIRAAKITHFACVRKAQILYRVLPGSVSANTERHLNRLLKLIDEVFGQAPPEHASLKAKCLGNLHFYLAQRTLDASEDARRGTAGLKLLRRSLQLDPSRLATPAPVMTVLAKALAIQLLPPSAFAWLIQSARKHTASAIR